MITITSDHASQLLMTPTDPSQAPLPEPAHAPNFLRQLKVSEEHFLHGLQLRWVKGLG